MSKPTLVAIYARVSTSEQNPHLRRGYGGTSAPAKDSENYVF